MAETGHKLVDLVKLTKNAAFCDRFHYAKFISKVPFSCFALNRIQKR
jgi:hypothetical protein